MSRRDRMLRAIQQSGDKFWDVKAATNADGGKAGEVFVYGYITGSKWFDDDVAPKAFKKEIDALGDIETLYVRVNSPGGSVWAGNAIYNILRRVDAEVVVTIDGLAASAASVIAMAGDKVVIAKNGMLMIHDAWTVAIGNAQKLRKAADVLDKIKEGYLAVYQEKTGLPKDEIVALLAEETWFTAEEALEKGFVDQIDESKEVKASLEGDKLVVNGQEFDASIFGVLPPFEGLTGDQELKNVARGFRVNKMDSEGESAASPGAIRRAFGVIAAALGFGQDDMRSATPEEVRTMLDELGDESDESLSAETKPYNQGATGNETVSDKHESNTKGSGEMPKDVKGEGVLQPEAATEPALDIKNMDPQAILNKIAELEARAEAAEGLARAERDKRVESEFVERVKGYGTLPINASEFGPVMKRASEALSKEDFDKIEAVLKAAGEALEQSDLFNSVGYSGEGDSSAVGQYRAKLQEVKAENPDLSEAEASLEAFKRLPDDVQNKVYDLDILPSA